MILSILALVSCFIVPIAIKLYFKRIFKNSAFFKGFSIKPQRAIKYNEEFLEKVNEEEERLELEKRKNAELEILLTKLYGEINTLKQKEHEEKIRRIELENSKDPKIINEQLKTKGKIICFEGTSTYQEIIFRQGFFGRKTKLDVDLKYNFGIALDWSTIEVTNISDKSMHLKFSKYDLFVQYVELASNDSSVDSTKKVLVKEFEPEFINDLLRRAEDKIKSQIISDKKIIEQAFNNLKYQILDFASKLGCNTITF